MDNENSLKRLHEDNDSFDKARRAKLDDNNTNNRFLLDVLQSNAGASFLSPFDKERVVAQMLKNSGVGNIE